MLEEIPAYLKEMQITLTADLIGEAKKQTLTLQQVIRNMRAGGMPDNEIESVLLNDLQEGGQLFGDFRKQMKSTVKRGLENIGQAEIREKFATAELWDWLGIVGKSICMDCLARHRMAPKKWEQWQSIGLPRMGATRCDANCRCDLVPAGIIEKEEGGLKR